MIVNKIQEFFLYTLAPNKPFGSLLEISPTNHIFLKKLNSEFQTTDVRLTDQSSKPLEFEDTIKWLSY